MLAEAVSLQLSSPFFSSWTKQDNTALQETTLPLCTAAQRKVFTHTSHISLMQLLTMPAALALFGAIVALGTTGVSAAASFGQGHTCPTPGSEGGSSEGVVVSPKPDQKIGLGKVSVACFLSKLQVPPLWTLRIPKRINRLQTKSELTLLLSRRHACALTSLRNSTSNSARAGTSKSPPNR